MKSQNHEITNPWLRCHGLPLQFNLTKVMMPLTHMFIKRSLEVKLPTIWRVEKQGREAENTSRVRRKKLQLPESQ